MNGQREAERVALAELAETLRGALTAMTEVTGLLASQVVNSVLEVNTELFPAAPAYLLLQFKVACGAIEVCNHSAGGVVTVHAAGSSPDGIAPLTGRGVYRIPAGQRRVVSVASREITLYGTAGDAVSWQAWTAGARPVSG